MIDRRGILAGLAGVGVESIARATELPVHPPASAKAVSLWTSAALADRLKAPLHVFEQASGVRVTLVARGSDVAMAALYTGQADIALIGRKATESERQAFEWVRQYPLAEVALDAGSPIPAPPPIAIMVNRANPITSLSMLQLRDIFLRPKPLFWRDFGVTGPIAGQRIFVAMPNTEQGTGRFLRAVLAEGRAQLAWDRIHEYPGDDPAAIARAVVRNPGAIGFGAIAAVPAVSTIAIAGSVLPGDPRYPLARQVYLYVERPLKDVRPAVRRLIDCLQPLPSRS